MRIWPGLALDSRRAARLTLSPITVYSMRSSVPTVPATDLARAHPDADRDGLLALRGAALVETAMPACMASAVRMARRGVIGVGDGGAEDAMTRRPGTCPGCRRA